VVRSLPPKSITVVIGTRPELIKMAPVVARLGEAASLVLTGQHFDHSLSGRFLEELDVTEPDAVLGVGGRSRAGQVAEAVRLLDELLAHRRPLAVVVHGDTNSTLAGALVANAQGIPLVHVEAGLRSYDRTMPEEHTRVVVDHLSDLLLAPTEGNRANLLRESIDPSRIQVTGNTIVEMARALLPAQAERLELLSARGLERGGFVVATIHRVENTESRDTLEAILGALASLDAPVLIPMHPRTLSRARAFGFDRLLRPLQVVEPMGYREFLSLLAECAFAVTDSGGVQEEASVLDCPLLVVRRSTERPEGLGRSNRLTSAGELADLLPRWWSDHRDGGQRAPSLPNPFGDVHAGDHVTEAITGFVSGPC